MSIRMHIFGFGLLFLLPCSLFGQFHTLPSDSMRIRPYSFIKARKGKATSPVAEKELLQEEKERKGKGESLARGDKEGGSKDTLRVQQKVSQVQATREAIQERIFGHLEERMNVCLPLDFLKVSSKYGARKDPITRCETFHDGVDLVCREENVYAMLPAVVKKVHRGNKGYGNCVVLNHGALECLYGHLDEITVREKEIIEAGTIVGVSGNTGKSTGHHLHIRLRKKGKSVDPLLFINFLRAYINDLNEKLEVIVPRGEQEGKDYVRAANLNLQQVYAEIRKHGILFPHIVLSQAVLETGHFSSRVCLEYNNLFGLRRRNGKYYQFERWEDSVVAYRDYVQYKYRGGNYFDFLDRIGYAEDKAYTLKVRMVAQEIKHKIGDT